MGRVGVWFRNRLALFAETVEVERDCFLQFLPSRVRKERAPEIPGGVFVNGENWAESASAALSDRHHPWLQIIRT